MLPLKQFQCLSDWRWPSLVFSSVMFFLFPLADQWCDVLGFVAAGSVSSSSTLHIFQVANHLWLIVALPASLSAWSFPFPAACPKPYIHWSFQRWMLMLTHASLGLPLHLFLASSLNLWGGWPVWSDIFCGRWKGGNAKHDPTSWNKTKREGRKP